MAKKSKKLGKRKLYFRMLKGMMKSRYKRPAFVYLGEEFENGALVLSNHEGTDAPMSLEIYSGKPLRMWGASEMNSGLRAMYKYQTRVYYHEKKGWSLFGARAFCLIASPLTNLFYSGLDLISTYHDARLVKTIRESEKALDEGYNVVIYPEDSTNGYLAELEGFHAGFIALCEARKKKGKDTPIFVTYFRKSDGVYFVDKPVMYSSLSSNGETREEIAKKLLDRCNQLGKMEISAEEIARLKKEQKKEAKKKK